MAKGFEGAKPGDEGGLAKGSEGAKPGDGGGIAREPAKVFANRFVAGIGREPGKDDVCRGGGGMPKEPEKDGANPGDGGGFGNKCDELEHAANCESALMSSIGVGAVNIAAMLKRPNLPGSDASSF